ncbi:hypothetical protein GCM10010247_34490 [Streptomyces calvus]|nr:hypothetical protein GCM10010247_34490 [Streptomyces calvus]
MPPSPELTDVLRQGRPGAADGEAVAGGEGGEIVLAGCGRRGGRCVEDLTHIRCFR